MQSFRRMRIGSVEGTQVSPLPGRSYCTCFLNFQFLRVGAPVACLRKRKDASLNTVYTLKCTLVFLTSTEIKRSLWN